MKNLIKKIAEARSIISIGKTGVNKFANFNYYQVDEIYAQAKEVFKDLGLVTVVSSDYLGDSTIKFTLEVFCEDSEKSLSYSVITKLNEGMKGAQPAQEAGAAITYATKYLYGLLLMIDDGKSDPDKNNDFGKSSSNNTYNKALTRTEIQEKIKALPADKFRMYADEVAAEKGKPVDLKFWKNDKLLEIAKKEGWQ